MARILRVPLVPLVEGEQVLPEEAAHYVGRVHRLAAGSRFVAFDPEARREADVEVLALGRHVAVRVEPLRAASCTATTRLTLLQSLGKSDKPDQVIRDATALGVERIVLVLSARSVVRVGNDGKDTRRERWQKIAVEAARQSGRGDVPEIVGPLSMPDSLARVGAAPRRLCLVPGAESPLSRAVAGSSDEPLAVLVGPEGGLTAEEVELAVGAGFVRVRLFDFVLRTETAAVAALGALLAVRQAGGEQRENDGNGGTLARRDET